jgi:hypothetical protein
MSFSSRRKEMEERRDQRVQREDAAGKLAKRAPDLATLSLVIRETRPEGCVSNTQYTRRVVVEHAPALFEVPCSYPQCEDGGYDVTREVLAALAGHQEKFEGTVSCRGRCATLDCARVLHYVATATYRKERLATADALPRVTVIRTT